MRRYVLHLDLDQFIAAVEVLRRPELRGVPVIVGGDGDPTKRGVVSTASYEARTYGVHSAMPLRTAYRRCPDAVFLPVDAPAYEEASARVMEVLRELPAVVEVFGWDEAYLEVETDDPESLARDIQRAVLARTELWCSIGIGDNKLQAKTATERAKPAGVYLLTTDRWNQVMDGEPVRSLWGIGKRTSEKLARLGVRTVGELATADPDELAGAFGPRTGPWFQRLARGESDWPVSAAPYRRKSVGKERTFQQDLTDPAAIRAEVARLAREAAGDVAREGRSAKRVVVKVRFAPFFTHTHQVSLAAPTEDAEKLEEAALEALAFFPLDRPIRLLGVRADLSDPG
jgi:DNA polymerase IV